jgi:hypothetical protein
VYTETVAAYLSSSDLTCICTFQSFNIRSSLEKGLGVGIFRTLVFEKFSDLINGVSGIQNPPFHH